VIASAITLVAAAPAAADTINVTTTTDSTDPCTGNQCPSIRSAIQRAEALDGPDTIRIPAGNYQLESSRLHVSGGEVTFAGDGAGATVIIGSPQFDGALSINGTDALTTVTLRELTVRGGRTEFDGGNVDVTAATVTLDRVHLVDGHADGIGGGLANDRGTVTIRRSVIENNEGGALANRGTTDVGGRLTVIDTTIAENIAVRGAALTSYGSALNRVRFERVTSAKNLAGDGTPGGIEIQTGELRLKGSILADIEYNLPNIPSNCGGSVAPISEGGNVATTDDCNLTGPGDLQNADPRLAAELSGTGANRTYALLAGSPAIDRFECTGTDQRGVTRPQGPRCDSGAYELDLVPDTIVNPDLSFSSTEPGATFECALEGLTDFAPCTSPYSTAGLAPGTYTLLVRAVDPSGQRDPSPARTTFTVPGQPTPEPTPTPTPEPTPVFGRQVVVKPVRGTVLICLRRQACRPLRAGEAIPIGSTVDTKKGEVELTSLSSRNGKPQTARFRDGIFRISQSGQVTVLTLTEALDCRRSRASTAQKKRKPKTRRLWGNGKGKFRVKGQYSAATIRGTKWLVQDGCGYTRTKVTVGSVLVRDQVRKRNIVVRRGKTYTARSR